MKQKQKKKTKNSKAIIQFETIFLVVKSKKK